ncbi:MAG: hypothetical protein ACI8W8_002948 [Rhodothermales bacterium]|jgi:hypothetical protein
MNDPKQLKAVFRNSLLVSASDPFFLVLHLAVLLLVALLGAIPGFTHGEHIRLLRDQSHALIFMVGCLGITFGLIRVVTDDIRRGAGPELRSRPVGPTVLLLGKWLGVCVAMGALYLSALLGYLWISEVAFRQGHLNSGSLTMFMVFVFGGLILAGWRHFAFGGSFPLAANLILGGSILLGCGLRMMLGDISHFDFPGLQCGLMLMLAMFIFAAIMLPIAVLADSAIVLTGGVIVFFFGLISDYLVTSTLSGAIAGMVKAVLPNWQLFWVADRIAEGASVPVAYLPSCLLQVCLMLGLCLIPATMLYERLEVRQ